MGVVTRWRKSEVGNNTAIILNNIIYTEREGGMGERGEGERGGGGEGERGKGKGERRKRWEEEEREIIIITLIIIANAHLCMKGISC